MCEPVPLHARLDSPADAPVLVLGNSLGTSRRVWYQQVDALRAHFRLLCYELPGHGGSDAEPGPYSIGKLGAGVLALLDSADIERAAYCGISLGGMIGIWLAANHPARVSALGLVCTSAYMPTAASYQQRADHVRADGMAPISAAVVGRWFTPAYAARYPAVAASFAADLERTDPEGYAGCCEALARMDLRASLGAITAPTIVISASDDTATPPGCGAEIAAAITGSRLRVIRGAAHLANVSSGPEVTVALLGHLRAAIPFGERRPPAGKSASGPGWPPVALPADR